MMMREMMMTAMTVTACINVVVIRMEGSGWCKRHKDIQFLEAGSVLLALPSYTLPSYLQAGRWDPQVPSAKNLAYPNSL